VNSATINKIGVFMLLEVSLIGLLSVSQPNLLNEKPPDLLRPSLNVEAGPAFMNYEADVKTSGETLRYRFQMGAKLNEALSFGYENRAFEMNQYGKAGDYIFVKISYRFKD
jgi:hypothetical protein